MNFQSSIYAFRKIRRTPGFTLLVVLVLGLAIGVNTSLFSTVKTVLLEQPPFPDPDRLVRIYGTSTAPDGWSRGSVSPPDFVDLREASRSFASMGAYSQRNGNLNGRGRPQSIEYAWVSPGLLRALGVSPLVGRLFSADESGPGADDVVILSQQLWEAQFNSDPDALGSTVKVDDQTLTIVGVLPADAQFPSPETMLWKPYGFALSNENDRGSTFISALGRLSPNASLEQAQLEVEQVARELEKTYPEQNENRSFFLERLHETEVRGVRHALLILWGAVGVILLIACVNVANLMLVRAEKRRREFSVRSVLGARPRTLILQLLTEALVLAILSTVVGLALSLLGNRFILWLAADRLPRLDQITLDWRVALFTIGLTLLTTVLFGLAPALQAARQKSAGVLRERGASFASGGRLTTALAAAQIALALTLVCGSGLLMQSFTRLLNVELGFRPSNLISFRIEPPMVLPPEEEMQDMLRRFEAGRSSANRLYREILDRVETIPGVESVSGINRMPLTGNMWQTSVAVEGRAYASRNDRHSATYRSVLPGYFETLGASLVTGRALDATDRASQPSVTIINRAMAEAYWGDSNPIGDRIAFADPPPSDKFWMTVVGVVDNIRHNDLSVDPVPVMYVPMDQTYFGYFGNWGMDIVARTRSLPPQFGAQVETILAELAPEVPVTSLRTMTQVMQNNVSSQSFTLWLITLFAGFAFFLAFLGVYAVISSVAAKRRPEYGIRTALGARPSDLLRSVLRQTLKLTVPGVALGLLVAILLSGYIGPLLYRISATDPYTLAVITGFMLLAGLAAGLYPAWRASRLNVNEVLQE